MWELVYLKRLWSWDHFLFGRCGAFLLKSSGQKTLLWLELSNYLCIFVTGKWWNICNRTFFLWQLNPRGSLCAWQAEGKIKRIIRRMMNWTVNILGEELQTHVRGLTKRRIPHQLRNALFRPFALNFILKSFRTHTISPHFITSVHYDLTPPPPTANKKLKL